MKTKKVRRLKGGLLNVATSMGKWTPHDDYLLLQGVLQLMNLEDVHKITKFSQKFTAKELEDRWHAVLYDVPISKMIYKNLKKLHFDDILRLKKLAPFSRDEEAILLNFDTVDEEDESAFEKLLLDNRVHFHEGRTAECLRKHWLRMKKLNLFDHQQTKLLASSNINKHGTLSTSSNLISCSELKHSLTRSFTELENDLDDQQIMESVELEEGIEAEISDCYNEIVRQIQRSEAELFLWQVLIDKITGTSNPFLDLNTFAVLFFGEESFAMKKFEITLGRSSEADFDLTKIKELEEDERHNLRTLSRRQFRIAMHEDIQNGFMFFLYNEGKLPVYVDGKVLLTRTKTQLYDKSFIEVGAIQVLFLVNVNLLAKALSKQT